MSREVHDHQIGQFVYKIQQLGTKESRKVMLRVLKAIGPAITVAGNGDSSERMFLFGFGKLCETLSDADLDFLCDTFARATMFSPVEEPEKAWVLAQKFDEHFAGHLGTMFAWLEASLRTNYANFFDDLPEELRAKVRGLLTEATESDSTSSKNGSTKSSGASSLAAGER